MKNDAETSKFSPAAPSILISKIQNSPCCETPVNRGGLSKDLTDGVITTDPSTIHRRAKIMFHESVGFHDQDTHEIREISVPGRIAFSS